MGAEALNQEYVLFRMGVKPMMVELLSQISGVNFEDAWRTRQTLTLPGALTVPLIALAEPRANKRASGRLEDLLDFEQLPDT